MTRRILVVAPHHDDEVLGVGGTMARLAAEGAEVHVVTVTRGYPPLFSDEGERQVQCEALRAHGMLGVAGSTCLDFPAAHLDTVPHADLNAALARQYSEVRPDVLFVPFNGDIHRDHQRVFLSALVAARPNGSPAPGTIYAYETVSETNWSAPYLTPGFHPTVFMDISEHLDAKIRAARAFESQMKPFPHERSAEALRALAAVRGSAVGRAAAEAFVLVRAIL
jgi:LmbE family N-acetylglucosaminyl deacetylase